MDFLSSLTLRPAKEDDYDYYLKLYPDLEIGLPPLSRELWGRVQMPGIFIIVIDNLRIGCIYLENSGADIFYIYNFVIDQEWRRRGVATKALDMLRGMAKRQGSKKWGLHCDVLHSIPHRMYMKAGMKVINQTFHVKTPIESAAAYEKADTRFTAAVVNDPGEWAELEAKYGINRGSTRIGIGDGCLPIKLVADDGRTVGYVLHFPLRNLSWVPSVDSPDLMPLLLQARRQFARNGNADDRYEHFWIEPKGEIAESIIVAAIPGALVCSAYDYLVDDL